MRSDSHNINDKLHLTPEGEVFLSQWLDDNDYIIAHTSGSTGKPKEIQLLKSDMRASAQATNRFFNLNENSVLFCPLSAGYIAGKMMIVRSIEADCTLYMTPPSNSFDIKTGEPIDLIAVVPSQLSNLARYVNIRNVIVGGAPLTVANEECLKSLKADVYSTYGMTETCSHVALRNVRRDNTFFEALPGFSFDVDESSRLVIMTETMSFGHLLTNDIVNLIDERHFQWRGRYDNVIITGAVKVFPEEVEKKIAGLLDRRFYIKGVPSEKWGQEVVMIVEGAPFDTTDIETELRKRLARHELPRAINFVDRLPQAANGKLKRV